ncbi:MAG: NUDIX hydrolase [Weeksellaceae bacterium]
MISCTFEHGHTANLRHVTIDAVIVKDEQILMVRRSEKLIEGGKWAIPGGYMDLDETSRETAIREVTEETGYSVADVTFFAITDNPQRRNVPRQDIDFIYIVEVHEKIQEPDHEVSELKWFDINGLPSDAEIAFDHKNIIEFYLKHRDAENLPLILS